MNDFIKRIIIACWLLALSSTIAFMFWKSELQYNLPTPTPANYAVVPPGYPINLASLADLKTNKPVFLHFFNPDCPCSRFNMTYFKTLLKKYNQQLNFAVVLVNKGKKWTEKEIQEKYELTIPVYSNNGIASLCGVYSTPQAAIIDREQKLFYRGNYNKSRYCTDKKTNYAQMAIDSILANASSPALNAAAFRGYGCVLPKCEK